MNVLQRTVVFFSMAVLLAPVAWANAPAGQKVVQNSATMQAQLAQAEKDVVAAKKELEEYEKAVGHYFRRCGNEVMDMARELESCRQRLAELEKGNGDAGEIKAVKQKIAGCERYFYDLEQERLSNPLHGHDITQVMQGLRRKVADLTVVRDRLKEEASRVPVKNGK